MLFQPYKHWHAKKMDKATRTRCQDFNKVEFLNALGDICNRTFKPSSIISAFCHTGLIPYNPNIVLNNFQESVCFWPTTPPLSTSSIDAPKITTPLTFRTLKQQASSILTEDVQVRFWGKLNTFVKESIVQAMTAGLVTEQLQEIETAQNA